MKAPFFQILSGSRPGGVELRDMREPEFETRGVSTAVLGFRASGSGLRGLGVWGFGF